MAPEKNGVVLPQLRLKAINRKHVDVEITGKNIYFLWTSVHKPTHKLFRIFGKMLPVVIIKSLFAYMFLNQRTHIRYTLTN